MSDVVAYQTIRIMFTAEKVSILGAEKADCVLTLEQAKALHAALATILQNPGASLKDTREL